MLLECLKHDREYVQGMLVRLLSELTHVETCLQNELEMWDDFAAEFDAGTVAPGGGGGSTRKLGVGE